MNTNIYIVKGGEAAQTGQVWHGAGTNSSLTEQGEKSATTLQGKIASWGIAAAYTSPQKRINGVLGNQELLKLMTFLELGSRILLKWC